MSAGLFMWLGFMAMALWVAVKQDEDNAREWAEMNEEDDDAEG